MPTYVIGARLTGNSIKGDQSFAQQVEAIGQVRHQLGGGLISAYVTFGRYDLFVNRGIPGPEIRARCGPNWSAASAWAPCGQGDHTDGAPDSRLRAGHEI